MALRSNYLEVNKKEEEKMEHTHSNQCGNQFQVKVYYSGSRLLLWCSDADVLSMRSGLIMTFTKKLMTWKYEHGYILERFLRPLPAGEAEPVKNTVLENLLGELSDFNIVQLRNHCIL